MDDWQLSRVHHQRSSGERQGGGGGGAEGIPSAETPDPSTQETEAFIHTGDLRRGLDWDSLHGISLQ